MIVTSDQLECLPSTISISTTPCGGRVQSTSDAASLDTVLYDAFRLTGGLMTFPLQPSSKLISLAAEMCLLILRYMTLSVKINAHEEWKGAYFACSQMQHEIGNELKPRDENDAFLTTLKRRGSINLTFV